MRLAQPDGRSCGAASLVMARRSVEASYAAKTSDQPAFAREVQRLHRQITSLVDSAGGLQVPWLRAIGTPPWAVAREMRLITGNAYDVNACNAFGQSVNPAPTARICSACSYTWASYPPWRKAIATHNPAIPPPMMIMGSVGELINFRIRCWLVWFHQQRNLTRFFINPVGQF